MKTQSKLGWAGGLLVLLAGCGTETPSAHNQALANEQNIADNGMIVDPEIPNAAETNVAATEGPAAERAAAKIAPVPPAAPMAPKAKAAAPKAKVDAPKEAPKAAPKPEPSPPPKAECLPEHRAAGHC